MASSQLQTDRYTDAIMTLERLRSLHVENRSTLELLARAYIKTGRYVEAQAAMEKLEATAGEEAASPLKAALLAARGDWAAAEELLRKQYAANPDDLATIHLLAQSLTAQKQPDNAAHFSQGMHRPPP